MTPAIVTLPLDLMVQSVVDWDIEWRGAPDMQTIAGGTVSVVNQMPRWIGRPSLVLTEALIARWRAIRWAARGRVNVYRVQMFDPLVRSRGSFSGASAAFRAGLAFSTGARFSTGSGFAYAPFVLAHAAAAGAEEIEVTVPDGGVVPGLGQIMSHDDRPFGVTSVTALGGAEYRLTVEMPLRAAIPEGGIVNHIGTGLFKADSDAMGQAAYGPMKVAQPQLSFVEYLNR